jgi:hypothetical protein
MSALTIPLPFFLLGVVGLCAGAVRAIFRRSSADLLLVASALLPLLLFALPGTPIFGGVKHWYNAMPFFAVLAARALLEGAEALARSLPSARVFLGPALAGLVLLPGALGIRASHPDGIGFYNELAGGIRGGAALGMQRSFWGGVNRPVLGPLASLPPGSRAYFDHMNYDAFVMYQREGTLPQQLLFDNTPVGAQGATVFEDREGYPTSDDGVWSALGTKPAEGVYVDEVTFVELYLKR